MGRCFLACAVLAAAGVGVAGAAAGAGAQPSAITSLLLLSFLPYAGLLVLDPGTRSGRMAEWGALVLSAAAGLVLVAAPSALSDDVYRYLWDGRVLLHGIDPYAFAPDAPALAALRDSSWSHINHRAIPTIYPPLAQLYFALGCLLWGSVSSLKLLSLLCHLGSVALVAHWARRRLQAGSWAPDPARCAYLLALNPLALSEAALGGHIDSAVGLAVLGAAICLDRGRSGLSLVAIVATAGFKLLGLVLWPLLRRRPAHAALAFALSAAMLWPLLGAGASSQRSSGVQHYAQRWRGNEGFFAVLDFGARAALDAMAPHPPPPGVGAQQVRLAWLAPLLARLQDGPLDPVAALRAERKERGDPAVLDRAHAAGLLARGAALAAVLALAFWLGRRQVALPGALRWVVLSVLLLSPQLHPWYLLWLLPLELALGKRVLLLWSAAALAAYAPLDGWQATREWGTSSASQGLQYVVVLLALLGEWWPRSIKAAGTARTSPG